MRIRAQLVMALALVMTFDFVPQAFARGGGIHIGGLGGLHLGGLHVGGFHGGGIGGSGLHGGGFHAGSLGGGGISSGARGLSAGSARGLSTTNLSGARSGNFTSRNFASLSHGSGALTGRGTSNLNGQSAGHNFVTRNFHNAGSMSNVTHNVQANHAATVNHLAGNKGVNTSQPWGYFGNVNGLNGMMPRLYPNLFFWLFPGYGFYGPWSYGCYGYGGWGGYGGYGPSAYAYYGAGGMMGPPVDPTTQQLQSSADAIGAGERAFAAGKYQDALKDWQHSMVDNPNNGAVVLLSAQAMFALSEYPLAANTVQMGMQMLPESEWGNLVKHYPELYPNIQNYTDQLRALEKSRDANPAEPARRFLLGYHFGYLGYPRQAVRELDKALDLEPRDLGAAKLRDLFAAQAGLPARPTAAAPPATRDNTGQREELGPGVLPPPEAGPVAPSGATEK